MVISADKDGETTDYTYGLERISASTGNARTEYVYDGRGSVIGEVSKSGFLSGAEVTTKAYTPFGEQIGEKTSGFGYNGEYYNAVTGMVYLRARFYEPEMNRFSQKDIMRGSVISGTSLNRYLYCGNDPVNFIDPSGESVIGSAVAKAVTATASAAKNAITSVAGKSAVTAAVSGAAAGTKAAATNKPVQTTTQNVNPINTVQATNQAKYDAKRAADFANAVAPGSLQARQAVQAYAQTMQYSQAANATHNPALAQQAINASRSAVNYANSAVSSKQYSSAKAPTTASPQVESPMPQSYVCGHDINALGAGGSPITWADLSNALGEAWSFITEVVYPSIEFSAGAGMGIGASANIEDAGLNLLYKYDTVDVFLDDGKWYLGTAYLAEASIDIVFFEAGVKDQEYKDWDCNEVSEKTEKGGFADFKFPNGIGGSAYLLYGVSFSLEINYIDLAENYEMYKENH